MTPEERAAQFTALTAEMDSVLVELGALRDEIATRQVSVDQLEASFAELRVQVEALVPVEGGAP